MSLIDEALKRARQEAARQDSAQAEGRYARVPVYEPPSRNPRAWLLPVVVAGCLAVGIGVGLIASRGGSAPSAPPPAVAENPAPVASQSVDPPQPPATAQPETEPRPVPAPADLPRIVEEAPVPVAPPPVRPSAPPVQQEAPRPVAPTPAAPTLPSTTPVPPSAGPEIALPATPPASTYVREVPLPEGGTLRLNGIAFSGQPVALFGDKVVSPGESVNGFTVVEIEAKRVKLQGQNGATVYVTLR